MHATAVANTISRLDPSVSVHIFEVNVLSSRAGALFIDDNDAERSYIHDSNNNKIAIGDLSLVWWRRTTLPQLNGSELDSDDATLVNRDSQAFLEALFVLRFVGGWINHPWCARRAESKPLQMLTAKKEGLNIPQTLFSNDPEVIRQLMANDFSYIVKSIAGLPGRSLLTQKLTPELASNLESVKLSPACYQRFVEGDKHVRLLAFGSSCVAVTIPSSFVDSRADTAVTPVAFTAPSDLQKRVQGVLYRLGLAMGVFDFKIDTLGSPFFLEVNQQGQFLYLEAMANFGFITEFARFLIEEAKQPNYSLNFKTHTESRD